MFLIGDQGQHFQFEDNAVNSYILRAYGVFYPELDVNV
jgi:hypothetical protein